jgi:hypothetical protein
MATSKNRKNRKKAEVVTPAVKVPQRVTKQRDTYVTLMPHEVPLLREQIKDFYQEINLVKAVENIDVFISDIVNTLKNNPYQFFYVALDPEGNLLGYHWFYIDRNILGECYAYVEQDYLIPEIRDTLRGARIHKNLLQFGLNIMQRCGGVRINTVVRSKKLEDSRRRLGFKSVEIRMTYEGSSEEFVGLNPLFAQYSKS